MGKHPLPKYSLIGNEDNDRSKSLRHKMSNTSLSPASSQVGLNNTLGQGLITAQIGNQAN